LPLLARFGTWSSHPAPRKLQSNTFFLLVF